jgi:NTP pyrophosphatase (non-canonical NTP hydrolase)
MGTDHDSLKLALREFAAERDWGQFHSPKNLAAALSVEAGELLEHFQWLTEDQSRSLGDDKRSAISQELADVFIYLVQLSDHMGIDLLEAAREKIEANARKYPAALAKGSIRKYTDL